MTTMPAPEGVGFASDAKTATIAESASLSGAVDLFDQTILGIQMPSAWTTETTITFQVSNDNSTFFNFYKDGVEFTITGAAASLALFVDPAMFIGWRYVKLRSGTAASPTAQASARTITLATRRVS